jgi:hypothetical protein
MFEPAPGVGEAHRHQHSRTGGIERFTRAGLGCAQARFDFRPAGFDRRQVGSVGRQIEQTGPTASRRLLDPHGFVCPQTVHHDDITRSQAGPQHLLHTGAKHGRVGRPIDGHDRLQTAHAHRPQPGHVGAVVPGHAADDPFPGGGPPVHARHRQIHTRLIHKFQAPEVEPWEPLALGLACLLDARSVALAGVERLFLRGKPSRCSTRHIVARLTRTPVAAATLVLNSCKVASG